MDSDAMWAVVFPMICVVAVLGAVVLIRIRSMWLTLGGDAEFSRRADQQQAWLDAGDPRGIYGDFMPPAMFLESERVARKPSNDGTPLLTRAAAMVKRAEYLEKHWGAVRINSTIRASIDTQVSIEMRAIQRFLDRCAKREGMTYCQFVDYVRGSAVYQFRSGDGSVPLSAFMRSIDELTADSA